MRARDLGLAFDATATELLAEWNLRRDDAGGLPRADHRSVVLPVRSDGRAAVLKVAKPTEDNAHEHLVLRQWDGVGAARLLRADPRRRALLLERLGSDDLTTVPDEEACAVVAGLYTRLHRRALPQLTSLSDLLPRWSAELADLPRSAPIPHRLVEQATAHMTNLAGGEEVTLHGDLHYGKVLAAERETWLVVGPRPLRGDPHYDIAPMLWTRWDEGRQIRHVIRHRLFVLTDTPNLDEERARAWVLVRAVRHALDLVRDGAPADSPDLTRFVTVAKAVQD